MSKSGSDDFLTMVDMDDVLGKLDNGDDDFAVSAAAAMDLLSFDEQDSETVDNSKDAKDAQESTPAVQVPQAEQEEEDQNKRQEDDAGGEEEKRKEKPRPAQKLEVNVDASPLKKQEGLDRFKELEKRSEEQKKQLKIEEAEVEKCKSMYAGKKWVVKPAMGPLRPQEAGELAVACAVKPGEKKSPREEIEDLTRQEEEKKKKAKALERAATKPLSAKPPPVSQPSPEMKDEKASADDATGEEGVSEMGEGKEGEGGQTNHEEEAKTCTTEAPPKKGSGQDLDIIERQPSIDVSDQKLSPSGGETKPTPQRPADGVTDVGSTAGGVKSKVKDKLRYLACLKKNGVTEPQILSEKYGLEAADRGQAGNCGELSDTHSGGIKKRDSSGLANPKGVFL